METFKFNASDMVKGKTNYIRFRTRARPEKFILLSERTGNYITCHLDEEATTDLYMVNEGWDGEYDCHIYKGKTPNGLVVTVELGCDPYFENPLWEESCGLTPDS